MTDKVTPIRATIQPGDPLKQQVIDTLGELFEVIRANSGKDPVAVLMIGVGEKGDGTTLWYVKDDRADHASLYLARALQLAQIDLHNYQIHLNEGCPHG